MPKQIVIFLFLFFSHLIYGQNEIAINVGFSYNDYVIINNPDNLFKEINLSKKQPLANVVFSTAYGKFLYSFQVGVINFNKSYYLEDDKLGYEHATSYSYYKFGYNFGKRWYLDSKHNFATSTSIGVHMILKQRNIIIDNVGTYLEYKIDENEVTVINENVAEFKNEIAIVSSTCFKAKLFKGLHLNVVCDFNFWRNTVFVDSKYSVLRNRSYIGDLKIRAFKPVVLAYLGLSYNF